MSVARKKGRRDEYMLGGFFSCCCIFLSNHEPTRPRKSFLFALFTCQKTTVFMHVPKAAEWQHDTRIFSNLERTRHELRSDQDLTDKECNPARSNRGVFLGTSAVCVGFLISEELFIRHRIALGTVLDTVELYNDGVLKAFWRERGCPIGAYKMVNLTKFLNSVVPSVVVLLRQSFCSWALLTMTPTSRK